MRVRSEYFTLLAVILLAVILIGPDTSAPATATSAQSTPTSIAIVDLKKLWDELDEQRALQQEIQRLERDLLEKLQLRKDAVATLQADRDTLEPGSQRFLERSGELLLAKKDAQAFAEYSVSTLDLQLALNLQKMYWKTNDAVRQLAVGRFQLILYRDVLATFRLQESSRLSRIAQVRQQIASRTMLHAEPSIDLTDELVQRMNNAYAYATADNDR
ncbi:MAG: hypothetical protein V3T53_07770 [Phycisphaerales bacterium]